MMNIEEYIELSKNKKNISNGGSDAYSFDDLVLIKYYRREEEELIAKIANEKNEKGVRTPKHLAIKREYIGGHEFCWVLQEKAKGVNLEEYYSGKPEEIIKFLQDLSDAPNFHYEKCLSDLSELFHMGLELKPKNVFYDNSKEDGGFTFIDLQDSNSDSINFDSICEIQELLFLTSCLYFSLDFKETNETEKDKALELYYNISKRFFVALEKLIPNFNKFRRCLLRSYKPKVLDYFKKNGIYVGDLSLNTQENKKFNECVEVIINEYIEKISSGKNIWLPVFYANILADLKKMGVHNDWKFHHSNPIKDSKYFEDEYKFDLASKESIEEWFNILLEQRIIEVAKNSNNCYILTKKEEIIRKRKIEKFKEIKNVLEDSEQKTMKTTNQDPKVY